MSLSPALGSCCVSLVNEQWKVAIHCWMIIFPLQWSVGGKTLQNPSLLWVQQTKSIRKPLEGSKKLWMENKILMQSKRAVVYKEQMGKCWVSSLKDKDLNLIQLSRGSGLGFLSLEVGSIWWIVEMCYKCLRFIGEAPSNTNEYLKIDMIGKYKLTNRSSSTTITS